MTDVQMTREGPVATLTLDRPDRRNALDPALLAALAEATTDLAEDPAVRVVVLPTAASAGVVAGRGVVVAALTALGPGPGVGDGGGAVVGPRVAGMVVDVGVGAGCG